MSYYNKRDPHPLAGKTVKIRNPHDRQLDGAEFHVEDWWVNVAGRPWAQCPGNPACMNYGVRIMCSGLPRNDEVVYGKIGCLGRLVHETELVYPGAEVNTNA